jgi:hypothetical protein
MRPRMLAGLDRRLRSSAMIPSRSLSCRSADYEFGQQAAAIATRFNFKLLPARRRVGPVGLVTANGHSVIEPGSAINLGTATRLCRAYRPVVIIGGSD